MRVLIVDDSQAIRVKLKASLQALGHEVVGEAEDGAMAIRLFQSLRPDVVTLDIVMPGMDGLKALHEIRRLQPAAKVIMLSSAANDANRKEAKDAGAIDFLAKPFELNALSKAMEAVAKRIAAERAA